MERKLHLLCTIMSLLMVTSCVTGQGLTQCTWDSKSCSCETNKGTISLAPLSKSTPYKIVDTANNQNFYWSPCKDFKMAEAGITAGAIQQQLPSMYYEIGSHSNANSDTTSDGYARFYMSASDHQRATYVQCQCASGFDLKFIEEKPETEYQFVLKADHCCPGYVPSGEEGISPGSILVIVFFALVIVYLVGGTLFMVFAKKASGRERIPNVALWAALPGLIKDGVLFTFTCGKRSTYNKM